MFCGELVEPIDQYEEKLRLHRLMHPEHYMATALATDSIHHHINWISGSQQPPTTPPVSAATTASQSDLSTWITQQQAKTKQAISQAPVQSKTTTPGAGVVDDDEGADDVAERAAHLAQEEAEFARGRHKLRNLRRRQRAYAKVATSRGEARARQLCNPRKFDEIPGLTAVYGTADSGETEEGYGGKKPEEDWDTTDAEAILQDSHDSEDEDYKDALRYRNRLLQYQSEHSERSKIIGLWKSFSLLNKFVSPQMIMLTSSNMNTISG